MSSNNKKDSIFTIKYSDSTLDSLDLVLSGILSNKEESVEILNTLKVLVSKEECEGFYYIFMDYLERLITVRQITHNKKIIPSELSFKTFLNTHILYFLNHEEVNAKKMFEDIQVSITDTTEESYIKEQRLLYSICMKKYKLLESNGVTSSDTVLLLESLYNSCIKDYSINSARLGAITLNKGLAYKGVNYTGADGYVEITRLALAKILEKKALWSGLDNSYIVLDSPEKYAQVMDRCKFRMAPICKIGLPPIDNFSTLTTADIINITATEGTGKTTFCCALAAREIRAGFSVIYMCGETVLSIIMNMVLSHFIYLETGYEISWKEISYMYQELTQEILDDAGDGEVLDDFKNIPEEYYAIVNDCKYKFLTTPEYGKLIPIDIFTYNNFKQEVYDIIDAHPELKFGHIMIDHTDALVIDNTHGNIYLKDQHAAVGWLTKKCIDIKRERGIPTLTTSHTSFETEKAINNNKETGTRVGATNSGTSKDVDIVILFKSSPKLKAQGLIEVEVKKYRTTDDTLFKPFIVKKEFTACRFEYYPELQALLGNDKTKEINTSDLSLTNMSAEELIG